MAQQVRNIMIECGAKAEVESLMQQYATEAENMLQALNFSQEYTTQFTAFIQKAVWRKR
jgi:geranylgeranyl pyrophosphate synthase